MSRDRTTPSHSVAHPALVVRDPENGFSVLRTKARGDRDLVTVVGHVSMVAPGEWITAPGEWIDDRTHGEQFKARFMRTAAPSTVEGIEKYLGSRMIRGIGPVYARKRIRPSVQGEAAWAGDSALGAYGWSGIDNKGTDGHHARETRIRQAPLSG